jgi:hypothetical protein
MNFKQLALFDPPQPARRSQNVALTSRLSYKEAIKSGTFSAIEKGILAILSDGAAYNRRQLAAALKKEPSSLCKALTSLKEQGKIHIVGNFKCPITGRTVSLFAITKAPGR